MIKKYIKTKDFLLTIAVICFTFFFLWVEFVAINPISFPRIRDPYLLCDLGNINSWITAQGISSHIRSNKTFSSPAYLEVGYENIPEQIILVCKDNIPRSILQRALIVELDIEVSQDVQTTLALVRKGIGGPHLDNKSAVVKPESENINRLIFELDKVGTSTPKSNWLTGDFDEVQIIITPSRPGDDLDITLYGLYLK